MSVSVSVNGTSYTIPESGETGYGSQVTSFIQAIASSSLQKNGGTFTLTNDVDFGSSKGIKVAYLISKSSNPASAGLLRLANADQIKFRNAGNSADISLGVGSSDSVPAYGGVDLVNLSTAQTLTNKTLTSPVISVGSADHVLINNGSGQATSEASLAVSRGGTGLASYTAGDLIYATASTTLSKLAIGTSGQVLKVVGSSMQWSSFSGGINYVSSNPDAEGGTSGWATYADAAGTSPVDGAGGSPSVTWTQSSSSPLRGSNNFLLTKGASNRQGDGVSFDFTLDRADRAKPLQVSFDYEIASGTFADSDLTVWVYDVTNSTLIQPAPSSVQNVGVTSRWLGTFQTSATGSSYRLIVHVSSTSASAYTVKFDNFYLGPQSQSYGAALTDYQSYTPASTQGFGTIANADFRYKQIGDSFRIIARFDSGTVTASEARISLPSGYTIDSTKVSAIKLVGSITTPSKTQVVYCNGGQSYLTFGGENGNTLTTTGGTNVFFADIPIQGLSSNVLVSSQTDTRVVTARATKSGSQSVTAGAEATVAFDAATFDSHGTFNTSTGVYTVPVAGYYKVSGVVTWTSNTFAANKVMQAAVYKSGSRQSRSNSFASASAGTWQPSTYINDIVSCVAGDTIYVNVTNNDSSTQSILNGNDLTWVTIERLSGPSQIAASETVAASYTSTTGTVTVGTSSATVPFGTKVFDTHGMYNVSTGVATIPMPGKYRITASIRSTSAVSSTTIDYSVFLTLKKNSTTGLRTIGTYAYQVNGASLSPYALGSCVVDFLAGDTFEVQINRDSGVSSFNLSTNSAHTFLCFERIGN